jgi:hypothetical protein
MSHHHRSSNPEQAIRNNLKNEQAEYQGLVIRNSHTIVVTQVEAQALVLVQAALQAAIMAFIVVFGNEDNDVR